MAAVRYLIKAGEKFRVVGMRNVNSHNYKVGKIYEATYNDTGCGVQGKDITDPHWLGNTITSANYELTCFTRKDINKQIEEAQKEYEEKTKGLKAMIDFMDKTGTEEYDDVQYKCYQAIKGLNSKASDMDKAKLIARLIKGEY